MNNMILTVRTNKNIETLASDLQKAVVDHNYGVMGTHDLKKTMAKNGVDFERECRIVEVCNPHQAKKVLNENMEISTALPCRISIYREKEETVMATLRPTALLGMFAAEGAANVAKEVEDAITAIMNDAAK